MKPQREGGGNNIYNEGTILLPSPPCLPHLPLLSSFTNQENLDLKKALETMTPEQLSAHILMDRIRPPAISTHVLRDGKLGTMNAVYELGIYGGFLANKDRYESHLPLPPTPLPLPSLSPPSHLPLTSLSPPSIWLMRV